MSLGKAYLDDIVFSFRKQKEMAEKAFRQVESDEDFFKKPGTYSNSIALIIKHLAGNLTSRWTDFLTADGEKPSRDRDGEFVIGQGDTRAGLLAAWDAGWNILFQSLQSLEETDLLKEVRIRGEKHTVFQAIHRSLTHTAYHTGQIVYLARLLKTEGWQWITIPPGQSRQHNAQGGAYRK
jgi:uncharacterized damage-inducible protein DinB